MATLFFLFSLTPSIPCFLDLSKVLLQDSIADAVRERHLPLSTHPDHAIVKLLLKSSLLKECHLTGVPGAWYSEKDAIEGVGQGEELKDRK